ncbi:MAG: hypothetical protein FD152_4495 [Xanthobacteraceae bacterium]|nr:MAG: hypothetical protein FD152_4495 [Xanthobacteraceae bacterium]
MVAQRRDIADAAAFGVMGPSGLPEVWLAVVARQPVDPRALITWCEERLPEVPIDRVIEVAAIPRNGMGKVERAKLKAQLTG